MTILESLGIGFGCLFFAGHLISAGVRFRAATNRNARLEAVGAVVPGLAGVLIVLAFIAPWPFVKLLLALAALPIIVLGRASYELVVFRRRLFRRRSLNLDVRQRDEISAQPPPIFTFNQMVVGEFTDGYPTAPGDITYMPYRGPGHGQMQKALKDAGQVSCSFRKEGNTFTLTIIACPKYRVLTASDLREGK